MNKKIVAIIIPLMMVLSGVVVAANTVADNGIIGTTTVENKTTFTVGEAFYLNVNEANYINYDYSSEWSIIDADGDKHVLISGKYINETKKFDFTEPSSYVSNGVKYTITNENVIGSYKVATERSAESDLGDTTLTWTVSITISEQTKYIVLTKSVSPSEPKKLEISWEKGGNINPVVGTVFNEKIVAKLGDKVLTNVDSPSLTFYAVDLPEGLSMSSDGHINGVPTASGSTTAKIAVSYTEGGVKKIATGESQITVVDKTDATFTIYLNGANMTGKSFYLSLIHI